MARKKHPKKAPKSLSNSWQLTVWTVSMLRSHWRVFGIITLVYAFLSLIFVRGLAGGTNIGELKTQLGLESGIGGSASVFAYLLGTGTSNTDSGAVYQFFIVVIVSLACIWALRQITTQTPFRVRDAFYNGMYPLVPFILVIVICAVQLIPFIVGSAIYGLVMNNGIAVHVIEKIVWTVLFIGLTVWSLYMLTASVFALYVVTLPNVAPLRAHRTARKLVKGRRWRLLGKLLVLPILFVVIAGIIVVPVIAVVPAAAQWVLFGLSMCALCAVHVYMYALYMELIND